jgi:transposase, IS6 family
MRSPSPVRFWSPPPSAFAGFRFPPEVIVLAARWYLRFNLSYRDVEELLLERGVEVDHVTVFRWVQRFTPLLADAARFTATRPATGGSLTRRTSRSTATGGT